MSDDAINLPLGWPTVCSIAEELETGLRINDNNELETKNECGTLRVLGKENLQEFNAREEVANQDEARYPTKLEKRLERIRAVKPSTAEITAADFVDSQGAKHRSEDIDDDDLQNNNDDDDADWLLDLDELSASPRALSSPRLVSSSLHCRRLWYWLISIFRCFYR